jgi:protein gp37
MAENSKIQWTDHTFNPWIGCAKVSPACKFCYAERFAERYGHARWGENGTRKRTSTANWNKPRQWNRLAEKNNTRYRVFCASLADVFEDHAQILSEWREDLFKLIKETPNLDWLLLTKRPENYKKFLPSDWGYGYENVWLGISVENQEYADQRIPILVNTNAAIRFISAEPLLGTVNLSKVGCEVCANGRSIGESGGFSPCPSCDNNHWNTLIDWMIIGGESGFKTKVRDLDLSIVKRTIDNAGDVKIFFKQLGVLAASKFKLNDINGGDIDEYPPALEWLKRRESPELLNPLK